MMRSIFLIFSFVAIFSAAAQAYTEPKEMKGLMAETEKRLQLRSTMDRIKKGEINPKKLQIIYSMLQKTSEHYIHNLNGATANQVYFHKDGHKEAVYDHSGKLVQDGVNDGSYNYYDRRKEPLKHFSFDTHPWIMWGASEKDPTSQRERIYGLVSDIEHGLIASLNDRENLNQIPKSGWDSLGQLQALSVFYLSLEKVKSERLYTLFEKNVRQITLDEITQSLRVLESGLNEVYQSKKRSDGFPIKTSKSFQKDADTIRLKHLKYYGELIEKYYAVKGKYPFQGNNKNPIYVYIANDKQGKAIKEGPDSPHETGPLSDFIAEIEKTLGNKINEYYDPQYGGDYKPNFYIYMIYQDVYFFAIHVHQPFTFAKRISDFYYKVEISNYATFRNRANDPKILFSSSEFGKELNKKIKKKEFFKEREEKYIHFTKRKE